MSSSGFETSKVEDDTYDIAIGNVPFHEIQIYDRRYEDNYYIHDYFFIRALDALKPGGIAIFITSKGTMDKGRYGCLTIPSRRWPARR